MKILHYIKSQIVCLFKSLTSLTLHRGQQKSSLRCLQNNFSLTLWCQYLFLCSNDPQKSAATVKTVAWGKHYLQLQQYWTGIDSAWSWQPFQPVTVHFPSGRAVTVFLFQMFLKSPSHEFFHLLYPEWHFLPNFTEGSVHFWKDLHVWCTPVKSWKELQEKVFQHFPKDGLCNRKDRNWLKKIFKKQTHKQKNSNLLELWETSIK